MQRLIAWTASVDSIVYSYDEVGNRKHERMAGPLPPQGSHNVRPVALLPRRRKPGFPIARADRLGDRTTRLQKES